MNKTVRVTEFHCFKRNGIWYISIHKYLSRSSRAWELFWVANRKTLSGGTRTSKTEGTWALDRRQQASIRTGGTRTSKAETRGSQNRRQPASNDEGTWSLRIKGFWGTKDFAFASANMPDTKTQAEGTPCSLVLQPNSVNKGWSIYGKQWT